MPEPSEQIDWLRVCTDAEAEAITGPSKGTNGVNWLGRPNATKADFAEAIAATKPTLDKNHQGKNHRTKNRPKHYRRQEGTTGEAKASPCERKEDTKDDTDTNTHTRFDAEPCASTPKCASAPRFEKGKRQSLRLTRPDSPLRDDDYIAEAQIERYGDPEDFSYRNPAPEEIAECGWMLYTGTSERNGPLPGYLRRELGYFYAIHCARWIVARAAENGWTLSLRDAFIGFLGEVDRALHVDQNHTCHNFRPIVWRIFRQIDDGDYTWLYELPSRYAQHAADQMRDKAAWLVGEANRVRGLKLNHSVLAGTLGFEELYELAMQFGEGDFDRGFGVVIGAINALPRGATLACWADLRPAAAKAAEAAAAAGAEAEAAKRQQDELERKRKAEEARLGPIREHAAHLRAVAERCSHRLSTWHPFNQDRPLALEEHLRRLGKGDIARGAAALEKLIEARQPSNREVGSIEFFLKDRAKAKHPDAAERPTTE